MKIIVKVIRKIVVAFGILYGVNVILVNSGLSIPINAISIASTTLLGIPAVISLLLINFVIR